MSLIRKDRSNLKEKKVEILSDKDMKIIVGSGNDNIHSIPPELFDAMFTNVSRTK